MQELNVVTLEICVKKVAHFSLVSTCCTGSLEDQENMWKHKF